MINAKQGSPTGGAGTQKDSRAESSRRKRQDKPAVAELQRLYQKAYQDYVRSLQDVWYESQRRYQEASYKYFQDLQGTSNSDDPYQRIAVQRDSLQAFQDTVNSQDLQKLYEEAYRNYLRDLRDAWAQLDVDSVELGFPRS